jgi:hypothetical protein
VADRREVVRFLDRSPGEHREADLAAGHDIGMVAEDVEPLGGKGSRGSAPSNGRTFATPSFPPQ